MEPDMKIINIIFLLAVTLFSSLAATAGTNCDCSKLLEQCGANIRAAGSEIQIITNTKECAQVTWYADNKSNSTIVVNGKNHEPSRFKSKPLLTIGNCNVCAKSHPLSGNSDDSAAESAECKKRKANLKISEKFLAEGRITPYQYKLSNDLVQKHCN